MIVVAIGFAVGVAGGLVGVLVGVFSLADASPGVLLGVWDVIVGGFLFFWMVGIVSEIQRSEVIDISRMLHLPISLREIFLVNYLASHLTVSIIIFLPGMLGLSLGLIASKGWSMIWLVPLVLSFIFMITAWTYCLRGWLVALMVNKRRRQAIIAGVTMIFILLCQLPNLFSHVMRHDRRHRRDTVESAQSEPQPKTPPAGRDGMNIGRAVLVAHHCVPFLWVGNGAMSLAMGKAWPAFLGVAGASLIGGLGLRRAYRGTLRFYQGQTTGKKCMRRPKVEKATVAGRNFLERQLPGVPEEAAALSLAFFRSLARAPEVKMALATNFFILLIFGGMIFLRRSATIGEVFKPFVVTGAVAVMFFGMLQMMFNQFGFDRAGFRTLVLSPVPRKHILLGKNLSLLPIAGGIGLTLIGLVTLVLRTGFISFLIGGLQFAAAFLLLSMAGNLLSVLVPYRIAGGSLKPTKTSTLTTFMIMVSHMLFPTIVAPIFVPPTAGLLLSRLGWVPAGPATLLLSAVVLALVIFFYRRSLAGLGALFQRREKEILRVVTQEVE